MASEAKTLRVQNHVSALPELAAAIEHRTLPQRLAETDVCAPPGLGQVDLFLLHSPADASWAAKFAGSLEQARPGNRGFRLALADLNSPAILTLLERLNSRCLLGIVVSRSLLLEDWPAARKAVGSFSEFAVTQKNVVPILIENVTLPPLLRLKEWFDFRNENRFDENLSDLLHFLSMWHAPSENASPRIIGTPQSLAKGLLSSARIYSSGISLAKERVVSNLLPVVELPKVVYSVETRFRSEAEVSEGCAGAGPLPFLLKGSRLYSMEPPSHDSIFAPAVSDCDTLMHEAFPQWLSSPDRAGWAIELLNNLFRRHAWKRGLRWDDRTDQYFFPRTKPKTVWWEIGGRKVSREVTAPHMGWIELENHFRAEVQYGWKHQSIRAGFFRLGGRLFLRLQPGWLLTELDGKTSVTTRPVGPRFFGSEVQEGNGQALRALRFWSAILAKGHHEIRINTGQAPVRTKLTPVSGFTQFGIPGDQMNYDQLMLAQMEDDLLIPALGPLGQ